MTNKLDDPKFAGQGPSAAYAFERDRVLHAEGTPEAAHAAGLKAHLASVWGADAKQNREGRYIQQGIGSDSNPSANHFAALKRYEGQQAWEKAVREQWKKNSDVARQLNLPELPRLGA